MIIIYLVTEPFEAEIIRTSHVALHLPDGIDESLLTRMVGILEFIGLNICLRIGKDRGYHLTEHTSEFTEHDTPVYISLQFLCLYTGNETVPFFTE